MHQPSVLHSCPARRPQQWNAGNMKNIVLLALALPVLIFSKPRLSNGGVPRINPVFSYTVLPEEYHHGWYSMTHEDPDRFAISTFAASINFYSTGIIWRICSTFFCPKSSPSIMIPLLYANQWEQLSLFQLSISTNNLAWIQHRNVRATTGRVFSAFVRISFISVRG